MNENNTTTMTPEQELAALKAENARLKAEAAAKANSTLSFKVSEKGGVSVYGMGRFPVTLYAEQWVKLLGRGKDLVAFMEANHSKLTFKEPKASTGPAF